MGTPRSRKGTGLGTSQGPPYVQQQAMLQAPQGAASCRDGPMIGLPTPHQVPLDYNAEAGG